MNLISTVFKSNRSATTLLLAMVFLLLPGCSSAQSLVPDESTLEHGDLIWPRTPGQFIPYSPLPSGDYTADKQSWNLEKTAYISLVRASKADRYEQIAADWLAELNYEQFREIYIGEAQDERLSAFGLPAPYVGHVAIILIEKEIRWVVEAVKGKGVRKIRYTNWLAERSDADVWLGRFVKLSSADKGLIVDQAGRQLGKPYSLMNRNLNDDSVFYCSKLVWFSVFNALGFALDDNPNPKRLIWYSPKQLMGSPYIQLVFSPGPYKESARN